MRKILCIVSIFIAAHGQNQGNDTILYKLGSDINRVPIFEWTGAGISNLDQLDQNIPKNQQFIKISTKALQEPIQLYYNISTENKKVSFNISDVSQLGALEYSEQQIFTINATKVEKSFTIVFKCLEDGNHRIDFHLRYKTQIVKLDFQKQCGKISNENLFINIFSDQQIKKQTITVVQDKKNRLAQYNTSEISFDVHLYTLNDSQILIDTPQIEYNDKSLANLQTAEFRNNDKKGGLLALGSSLNINIKFSCLEVGEVLYNLTFNSLIFETPFTFQILKACAIDSVEEPITNFTQFPILIGTIKDRSDVYRPGQVADEYNKSSKLIRVIPEEEDAEMFYVTIMQDQFGEDLIKKKLLLRNPILEYDEDILNVINDVPNLGQHFWRKPLDILLIFNCRKAGKSQVKMELDFKFGSNRTQTIPIHFVKVCGEVLTVVPETSFLGDLFYYSLCILAIMFGLYIINLFKSIFSYKNKDMMQKEVAQETFNIDTSYKRKYDKMQELPIRNTTVVLQE